MVSIILTILKIIGISILVILGIIVLLVLLVLFVPVRYKAGGNYTDSRADISGKASWLLGIASVTFRYQKEQPFHIRAKLFYIPVFDNLKKRKRKKKVFRKGKKEEPQLQAASVPEHAAPSPNADTTESDREENSKEQPEKTSELPQQETERTVDEVEIWETEDENTDKISIFQKIQKILMKFIDFFKNIKFTFQRMYVIMIKIKNNIKYYLELLQQESTKQAFGLCKKQLLRIVKNLCPQKYSVKLHLGFEDPATLGNVLAVWGMLYPWHRGRIDIRPEFEETIVEGSFSVKGRVSVYVFLWTAWLFFTDKNIKQLRKQLHI